mmetsp:Transcript_16737/g.28434  ORF Transcript_16737/g.28434 Transcript_16737/m.28434 type:complete len:160 (-) Transcript_16737:283-762(-)
MFYMDSEGDIVSISNQEDLIEAKEAMKLAALKIFIAKNSEEARELISNNGLNQSVSLNQSFQSSANNFPAMMGARIPQGHPFNQMPTGYAQPFPGQVNMQQFAGFRPSYPGMMPTNQFQHQASGIFDLGAGVSRKESFDLMSDRRTEENILERLQTERI